MKMEDVDEVLEHECHVASDNTPVAALGAADIVGTSVSQHVCLYLCLCLSVSVSVSVPVSVCVSPCLWGKSVSAVVYI